MGVQKPLKPGETHVEELLQLEPLGSLGPLAPDGQSLPIFATLHGAPVAVLPLPFYRDLMIAAVRRVTPAQPPQPTSSSPPLGLSTIERDPEVAEFLVSRFRGGVTVDQIRDTCRNTFGEDRTPSRNRIQRFRQRLQSVR